MKTKEKYVYLFDPAARRLNITKNGEPFGGFAGPAAEREFERLLTSGAHITITDMSDSLKNAKVRRLRAMWIKQGIDQYRGEILSQYGVESTADLSLPQLTELIDQYSNQAPASEHVRRQRSIILDLLTKLGVYKDAGDWSAVNAFLMQSRIAGKLLYQMNSDELNVLQRKLRSILVKREEGEVETNRLKLLN